MSSRTENGKSTSVYESSSMNVKELIPGWLPNFFTWLRVLLSFVLVLILIMPGEFFAFEKFGSKLYLFLVVYTVAALSDYFDGFLARKMFLNSEFGKFFDPLADKLMTLSIYLAFFFINILHLLFLPLLLIFFREVAITILRSFCMNNNIQMETEKHGKWKTTLQITSQVLIVFLLIYYVGLFEEKLLYVNINQSSLGLLSVLPTEWLRFVDVPFLLLPFEPIASYLRESHQFPEAAIWLVKQTPNAMIMVVMSFSLYSGTIYAIKNYGKIIVFLENKKKSSNS